jgi:type IV pilus assembly protein PilV
MKPTHKIPTTGNLAGFTLIEVLVALFVLSIGLLGLAALQVRGMQYGNESYLRTQATMIANDIIDRMRANAIGARNGNYAATGAPAVPQDCGDNGSGCATNSDIANFDLTRWYQLLGNRLPPVQSPAVAGKIDLTGTVTRTYQGTATVFSNYLITIKWQERDLTITQTWEVSI